MIYECVECGTTFKYEKGEHSKGYLVCPNCDSEDLRIYKIEPNEEFGVSVSFAMPMEEK